MVYSVLVLLSPFYKLGEWSSEGWSSYPATKQRIKDFVYLQPFKSQTIMCGSYYYPVHCHFHDCFLPFPLPVRRLWCLFIESRPGDMKGEWKWQVSLLSSSCKILSLLCHNSFISGIHKTRFQIGVSPPTWVSKWRPYRGKSQPYWTYEKESWGFRVICYTVWPSLH